MAIRVLVADDEPVFRRALADLFDRHEAFQLVGQAADAAAAIRLACRERPDVALIDVKMPGGGGARAAREIRRCSPATRVLALSAYADRQSVLQMLGAGATGYLVKGASAEEIVATALRGANGEGALSGQVASEVINELSRRLEGEKQDEARRTRIARRIEALLKRGGPSMVFQPIAELVSGRVIGVEALARFPHRPPRATEVWFDEADEVGLGLDLELAALTAAMVVIARLPSDVFLAVNVCPTTLCSERFRTMLEAMQTTRLVVEVTEHAPIADYGVVRAAVQDLRAKGGRLAVDDVGSGFASLRHVLQLAPDLIKLDTDLTRGIHDDQARRALAAGLTSVAAQIGADVIAEGIESPDELKALRDMHITYGQGYLFAHPEPYDRLDLARVRRMASQRQGSEGSRRTSSP